MLIFDEEAQWIVWRQISTATPRDGTPILLCYMSGDGPKVREAQFCQSFGRGRWKMSATNVDDGSPDILGWAPMPSPPYRDT